MKINNIRVLGTAEPITPSGDDGATIRPRLILSGLLSRANAEELKVAGAYEDGVDFKIRSEKFTEFGGEHDCHSLKLKTMRDTLALTIGTVSISDAIVTIKDGEPRVKLTCSYDSRWMKEVTDFLQSHQAFCGLLEIEATQGALDFSPQEPQAEAA